MPLQTNKFGANDLEATPKTTVVSVFDVVSRSIYIYLVISYPSTNQTSQMVTALSSPSAGAVNFTEVALTVWCLAAASAASKCLRYCTISGA